MSLIKTGLAKSLIRIDDERKFITYIQQNKKRSFQDPEEKVQAETYLKLIVYYNYQPQRIKLFASVKMGVDTREADIIVYNDDECLSPHIVVECKRNDISELEFNQAVNQAWGYAVAEGARFVWVTSGIKDEYYEISDKKPKKKISIPDIPQYGIDKLAKYKYVKGGFDPTKINLRVGKNLEQKFFEIQTITEEELTRRFNQAHNSLWAGGELNPSEAFDELDKLIFCKIWDEKTTKKNEPYRFQIFTEESDEKTNSELYKRVKALYEIGREKDPEVFRDDIRLSPAKIRSVVSYLESVNLNKTDLDSKGRAFEAFMGSYFRGDFGQYFTPRPIVKFIVDSLPITNDSKILDTSCGSGGFLLFALDKIRKHADELYPDYETDPDEREEHKEYWHEFAKHYLYGIEINEQISRTAKMNMILHDDGHTNVISMDGLSTSETLTKKNKGFTYNSFDFILTNPPFGSIVKQTERAYLHQYNLGFKEVDWLDTKDSKNEKRKNQNTEILFIEQCYKFLKPESFLAIVLPDGILSNSSLQYVRDQIEEWYRIVAVVSIPQTAFVSTGAGVKSSVLFLRKWNAQQTKRIQELKKSIQNRIKEEKQYLKTIEQFESEKNSIIKSHDGFLNTTGLTDKKKIEKTIHFKEWKNEISMKYSQKITELKEELNDLYLISKQREIEDYPIFMAIAEDIGYDATGKATNNNELEIIAKKLSEFINNLD